MKFKVNIPFANCFGMMEVEDVKTYKQGDIVDSDEIPNNVDFMVQNGILTKIPQKLNPEEQSDFLEKASRYQVRYPNLRFGQVLFHIVYASYPELTPLVTNTNADPFYNQNIKNFFNAIFE